MMKRILALLIAGCVLASGVAGCTSARDDSGKIRVPTLVPVNEVQVGDCMLSGLSDGTIKQLPIVPCDQPHVGQFFCITPILTTNYPSEDDASREALENCVPKFLEFTGGSYYAATDYDFEWVIPTEAAWVKGPRVIRAIVRRVDSTPLTGDLKGTMTGLPHVVGWPRVGDCTADISSDKWRGGVELVPCSSPHYYEVFASETVGVPPATDAELKERATTFCMNEYTKFSGVPFVASNGLTMFPVTISVEGWKSSPNHDASCWVGKRKGGMVGSLKDSKK